MISLRTLAKFLSSPIAAPGILFVLYGFGIDHTSILAPPPLPSVTEKFIASGIPTELFKPVAIVVGLMKVTVAVNNLLLKSSTISKLLFFTSVPGFALVAHSHNLVGLPMSENMPCIVMPVLLGILAFTEEEKTKSKTK
ncbi:hypothetical protein TrLO_g12040 [Triparma laevis f. longispina]|uniref:Uncharacterized protein n=1 Tax=Triparma laevis f. longispina TaxID=1714387 RepID=A0A9W7EBX1_9STRA|nr:hypothetical protein TrLO_g12040 [Triparma laevis f. longispina]